jgi:uncharacterized protein YqjF (DUF2071 family)
MAPHQLLSATAHRDRALPDRPWVMFQRWHDLLFAHWPVEPEALRGQLPPGLELDLHEGRAWLGVVPFRMSAIRLRGTPPVPGLSAFTELNVRTYVRAGGHRGVWFFSLDAASRLAVRVARRWFHLPYFDARMTVDAEGEDLRYHSTRTHRGAPGAELAARYGPRGPVELAARGTLEHFLTERYCLFAWNGRRLLRGDIHHAPWPLQPAGVELERQTMARAAGLATEGGPALVHFARALEVLLWAPVPATA